MFHLSLPTSRTLSLKKHDSWTTQHSRRSSAEIPHWQRRLLEQPRLSKRQGKPLNWSWERSRAWRERRCAFWVCLMSTDGPCGMLQLRWTCHFAWFSEENVTYRLYLLMCCIAVATQLNIFVHLANSHPSNNCDLLVSSLQFARMSMFTKIKGLFCG